MTTTHQRAIQNYQIEKSVANSRITPSCPEWVRDRILAGVARSAMRRAARNAVRECTGVDVGALQRDYRGWMRDGRRIGPGSGRKADWMDSGFDRLSTIARAVHTLGYRDAECRRIAHVLHRHGHAQGWELLPSRLAALAALPLDAPEVAPVATGYYSSDPAEDIRIRREFAAVSGPGEHAAPAHVPRWILFLQWTPSLEMTTCR